MPERSRRPHPRGPRPAPSAPERRRSRDAQDLLGNAAVQSTTGPSAGARAAGNLDTLSTAWGLASTGMRGAEWLGSAAAARGLLSPSTVGQLGGAASVLRVAGGGARVLSAALDDEAETGDRVLDAIQGGADMVSGAAWPNVAVSGTAAALSAGISIGRAGDEAARAGGVFHDDQGRAISASEFAARGAFDARETVRRWTGSEALGETAGALAFLPYTVAGALGGTGALLGRTAARGALLAEDLYDRFFGGGRKAGDRR